MITEFFMDRVVEFIVWLAGVFGEWTPPEELTAMSDGVVGMLQTYNGLGVWVSWPVVNACIAAAGLTWAVVIGIKLIQKLIAHVPGFGGSGA